jgi:hypothetical protein
MPTLEGDCPFPAPEETDDLDRLLVGLERLSRRANRTAHRADRVPECSGSEPELEATAREDVERRRLLGDHRRQAKRQVRDVGEDAETLGAGEQIGHQRPGLEKAPLIRVVLDAEQIQPESVGADGELASFEYVGCVRNEAEAEFERPAVITHHSTQTTGGRRSFL